MEDKAVFSCKQNRWVFWHHVQGGNQFSAGGPRGFSAHPFPATTPLGMDAPQLVGQDVAAGLGDL